MLTVKGKWSFFLVSPSAIAGGCPPWHGLVDKLGQPTFWSVWQVLRSLLPLALACVTWTMPAMARLPRCKHECDAVNSDKCYKVTSQRRALLDTIRRAEGTQEKDGYQILFGGGRFHDLTRHPEKVISKGRYTSAAAGAYQFLPPTWKIAKKALNLRDFGPDSQDQAALFLIQRRCALDMADKGELTKDLVAKLAPEWASFPKRNGESYYGQPVRQLYELGRFYNDRLVALSLLWPQLASGPPPLPERVALSPPTPARLIPVATSASCDGELMYLLDCVAAGGAPI